MFSLLFCWLLMRMAFADIGIEVSPDFTVDTHYESPSASAISELFTVDTRYGFASGANVSQPFAVDTRFSGSIGIALSGAFTVDTISAVVPSVAVTGRVTTQMGAGLAAAMIQAIVNNRVQAAASADAEGYYALPLLPPGTYEVRATRADFVSGIKRGLVFRAGQSVAANFSLAPRPSPPSTQPVTRPPPPDLTGPPTPNQLKVWNGAQFVAGASLALDKPTVILTHGYWVGPNEWADDMASQMTTALAAIGKDANVVAWDWEATARSLPGLAYSQTPAQGEALGKALAQSLPGCTKPVHFIGHSLGALVNAEAANYLHGHAATSFPASRTHMTTLDNAEGANVVGPVLDAALLSGGNGAQAAYVATTELLTAGGWVSPFPEEAAWMDNYISLVGYPSGKAVNVCLAQSAAFTSDLVPLPWRMHSYAHEWYRGTISQPQDSPMGHRYSYERLGEDAGLSMSYPYAAGAWLEQTSRENQFLLRRLSAAEADICQRKIAQAAVRARAVQFATFVNGVAQTVGNVTTTVVEKSLGLFDDVLTTVGSAIEGVPGLNLITGPAAAFAPGGFQVAQAGGAPTNTPAYAWFTVAIPSNATLLSFDFKLSGDPKMDCLSFGINGTNQFVLAGRFIPVDVAQNSGYLDVAPWAGQNVEFFFGITGGTSTNATVAVDGLRFYAEARPVLEAQPAGNQLVLSWPITATNFVLEASPTLSFSNVWSVVTNVPAVTGFQFSVTNSPESQSGFYRLRKQ